MRRTLQVLCLVSMGGLASCPKALDPLPFDVTVTANSAPISPQEIITIVVSAKGGHILDIALEYGDNSSDHYSISAAREALRQFQHVYVARGTYAVRATVTDASYGNKSATTNVEVR